MIIDFKTKKEIYNIDDLNNKDVSELIWEADEREQDIEDLLMIIDIQANQIEAFKTEMQKFQKLKVKYKALLEFNKEMGVKISDLKNKLLKLYNRELDDRDL